MQINREHFQIKQTIIKNMIDTLGTNLVEYKKLRWFRNPIKKIKLLIIISEEFPKIEKLHNQLEKDVKNQIGA